MKRHDIVGIASAVALALMWGLMMTSCGSKHAAVTRGDEVATQASTPYGRMIESYSDWNTLSCPVKIRMESPSAFAFSGRAYMNRGKSIHLSMRFLGMEFGVVRVEGDSVYCVDKLHRVIVSESLKRVKEMTGLDLSQLQDVLLGRWPAPERSRGFKTAGIEYSYAIDEAVDQLSGIKATLPTGKEVECRYGEWTSCALGAMPGLLQAALQLGERNFAAKIYYTPGSVTVNRDDFPSYSLPRNYRHVAVAEFLTTLKTL